MSEQVEAGEDRELHSHPQPRQYVNVAIVLALVTAAEVAIYYVSALRTLLVPLLVVFALIKFVLVALWFMHLRFDDRRYARFFVMGLAGAATLYLVVLLIFGAFSR
jgi:cytochrome c oxidase subunit 4